MAEPPSPSEIYLGEVSARLGGSRATKKRLLTEIRGHLDDAVAAHVEDGLTSAAAERCAIERLGPPDALLEAWQTRCARSRSRQRRSIALFVGTAAVASLLGIAQHADGRRDPVQPCTHPALAAGQACHKP